MLRAALELGAPASVLPAESEHARRLVRLETGVSTHAHMQDTDSGKNRDLGLPHSPIVYMDVLQPSQSASSSSVLKDMIKLSMGAWSYLDIINCPALDE